MSTYANNSLLTTGGITSDDVEQAVRLAVSMPVANEPMVKAKDYADKNVRVKVAKIIQSYTKIINISIWRNNNA